MADHYCYVSLCFLNVSTAQPWLFLFDGTRNIVEYKLVCLFLQRLSD